MSAPIPRIGTVQAHTGAVYSRTNDATGKPSIRRFQRPSNGWRSAYPSPVRAGITSQQKQNPDLESTLGKRKRSISFKGATPTTVASDAQHSLSKETGFIRQTRGKTPNVNYTQSMMQLFFAGNPKLLAANKLPAAQQHEATRSQKNQAFQVTPPPIRLKGQKKQSLKINGPAALMRAYQNLRTQEKNGIISPTGKQNLDKIEHIIPKVLEIGHYKGKRLSPKGKAVFQKVVNNIEQKFKSPTTLIKRYLTLSKKNAQGKLSHNERKELSGVKKDIVKAVKTGSYNNMKLSPKDRANLKKVKLHIINVIKNQNPQNALQ